MKTACVILNYNDSEQTISLVNEINNYDSIDHIIIVDNNSTDDSLLKFKGLENNKISVISSKRNGGYGYGNNEGIRFSIKQGNDITLIANPDVHFSNTVVKNMVHTLANNREVAICAPTSYKPNGEKSNLIAWKIQDKYDYIFSSFILYNKFFSNKFYKKFDNSVEAIQVDIVPGSFLAVNNSLFTKIGMYDEEIFLYNEEESIGIKLKNNELKTLLLLNSKYIHDHSVSISKSFPKIAQKKVLNFNSKLIVLEKYYKASKLDLLIAKAVNYLALIELKIYLFLGDKI